LQRDAKRRENLPGCHTRDNVSRRLPKGLVVRIRFPGRQNEISGVPQQGVSTFEFKNAPFNTPETGLIGIRVNLKEELGNSESQWTLRLVFSSQTLVRNSGYEERASFLAKDGTNEKYTLDCAN
jgi:hypothetical protein